MSYQTMYYDAAGRPTDRIYIDAMVLRDRDTDANGSLDERLYVMQDANFNVTAIVNLSGQVLERYTYLPYGDRTILNADWSTDGDGISDYAFQHGHQGGKLDLTTGLYHFRNREYSPVLGRWMQQDPMGYVDGMSLYQYEKSNTVVMNDPSGLVTRQVLLTALGKENAYHRNRPYYTATGVDRLFDELFATAQTVNVSGPPSGVGSAQYRPVTNRLLISSNPTGLDTVHELVHYIDDINDWYIRGFPYGTDYSSAEGLAYAMEFLLDQARYFQRVEIAQTPEQAIDSWKTAWQQFANLRLTVTYGRWGSTRSLAEQDIWDVSAKFSVRFSCQALAPLYEQVIQKNTWAQVCLPCDMAYLWKGTRPFL